MVAKPSQLGEIVAVDADGYVGPDARDELIRPHLDGLGNAVTDLRRDRVDGFANLAREIGLQYSRSPVVLRLEQDVDVALLDPHRIICHFGGADAAHHARDFRNASAASRTGTTGMHGYGTRRLPSGP